MSKGEVIKQKTIAGGAKRGHKHVDRIYQPNPYRLRLLQNPKRGPNFRKPRKKK